MKILFVSRTAPNPNGAGAERRAHQHLLALQQLGRVTLVVPQAALDRSIRLGFDLAGLGLERLLIRRDPTETDLRQQRWWESRGRIAKVLRRLALTHANDQRARPADAARWRAELGGGYDLLMAYRMPSAIWVDSVLPGPHRPPLTIVDLDDLESVAHARHHARQGRSTLFETWQDRRFLRWLRRQEGKLAQTWGKVLVCSTDDAQRLQDLFRIAPIVVPNSVRFPPEALAVRAGGPAELLFVGHLAYPPNIEAARLLALAIWPQVRDALGNDARLTIAGMDPGPEVLELGKIAGIEVLASVPDLAPLYERATLCVAPIYAGSGTRIKLIEAMAQGRAIITTTIGCEGLAVVPDRDLIIADALEAFAAAVIALSADDNLRTALAARGRAFGQAHYSQDVIVGRFVDELRGLCQNHEVVTARS